MFYTNLRKITGLVAIVLSVITGFAILNTSAQQMSEDIEVITFDVAEDATRFVFDEEPVHDDGLPAYGNSFVTHGYIYPEGILDDSSGILANGEPEFPDQVIGEWSCRGWFVGDGAHTKAGPWVVTTQIYDLGEEFGDAAIVSDGYETPSLNKTIQRAITGGTGKYANVRGDVVQQFLGFGEHDNVKLRIEIRLADNS